MLVLAELQHLGHQFHQGCNDVNYCYINDDGGVDEISTHELKNYLCQTDYYLA